MEKTIVIYFIVRGEVYFDRFLLLDDVTDNKALVTKVKFSYEGIENLKEGMYKVEIRESDYNYSNGTWTVNRYLYAVPVLVTDRFRLFDWEG